MFKKNVAVLIGFVLLTLCGCATKKAYDYAEFHNNLYSNSQFYSQYEIVYIKQIKDNEIVVVSPFLADSNDYLPENLIKLHFGLQIINPYKERMDVWVDYAFIGLGDEEFFHKKSYLYKSVTLPEDFLSIEMPYATNIHSQVEFQVTVDSNGRTLYESSKAKYRVMGD